MAPAPVGDDLVDIATELYALAPDAFVAARNARAATIADAPLAARVRALRKPLMAAWIVNLFVRERAAELDQALELAAALRTAQAELDAQALSTLGRQRRALIRSLADQAMQVAAAHGAQVTAGAAAAVEETLNAAMFDPAAAAAVASGRLIRSLDAGADAGAAEVADAVAGPLPVLAGRALGGGAGANATQKDATSADTISAGATPSDATPSDGVSPAADEMRARRERKAAERALRAARDALTQAAEAHAKAVRRSRAARQRLDELAAQEAQLRDDLDRVSQARRRAGAEADQLDIESLRLAAQQTAARERLDAALRATAEES